MKLTIFHIIFFFYFIFLYLLYSQKNSNGHFHIFTLIFLLNIIQSFLFDYYFLSYNYLNVIRSFFFINFIFFFINLIFEYLFSDFILFFFSQIILNVVNITCIRNQYETDLIESTPIL